jgi:hypothetical protein
LRIFGAVAIFELFSGVWVGKMNAAAAQLGYSAMGLFISVLQGWRNPTMTSPPDVHKTVTF